MHEPEENGYQEWAQRLQRLGLNRFAAAFLEASGPLNLLGAQLIYLGQPLLGGVLGDSHLVSLAHILENNVQTEKLIACLREDQACN